MGHTASSAALLHLYLQHELPSIWKAEKAMQYAHNQGKPETLHCHGTALNLGPGWRKRDLIMLLYQSAMSLAKEGSLEAYHRLTMPV